MEVLKQWVCDVCGEIIEKSSDGYVIWKADLNNKYYDFKIVHQCRRDSMGNIAGCDNLREYPLSAHLPNFLGKRGLVYLLSFIDVGAMHSPDNLYTYVKDMREFTEFFKRLQIPYYEEARLYWNKAIADGYFDGANEIWVYLPFTLQRLIEKYKN